MIASIAMILHLFFPFAHSLFFYFARFAFFLPFAAGSRATAEEANGAAREEKENVA